MSSKPKPVPEGYRTVTPYLYIRGTAKALDFYKRAFGAVEKVRMPGPGDSIMHAEIQIGDSMVMLGDPAPTVRLDGGSQEKTGKRGGALLRSRKIPVKETNTPRA